MKDENNRELLKMLDINYSPIERKKDSVKGIIETLGPVEGTGYYVILKDIFSVLPNKSGSDFWGAGSVEVYLPPEIKVSDYLSYENHFHMKSRIKNDLYRLCTFRADIDFCSFMNLVGFSTAKKYTEMQKRYNRKIIMINRYLEGEDIIIAVFMVTRDGTFATRTKCKQSIGQDKLPLLIAKKLMLKTKQGLGMKATEIRFGYKVDIPNLIKEDKTIIYRDFTPFKSQIEDRQDFNIFNHYLKTGQKLVPLIEVDI